MNVFEHTCPNCGNENVVRGKVLSQLDGGGSQVFRPGGFSWKKFSPLGMDLKLKKTFFACPECGLLWNSLDTARLRKVLDAPTVPKAGS